MFNDEGRPYPPTAQMATQQGQHLARNLVALIRDGQLTPFKFETKGTVASLGKGEAIGIVGKRKLYGWTAAQMKKLDRFTILVYNWRITSCLEKREIFLTVSAVDFTADSERESAIFLLDGGFVHVFSIHFSSKQRSEVLIWK